MAKGFKINGTDFDGLFEPARSGFRSVTFTGLSPEVSYMKRTGDTTNPNAGGYYNQEIKWLIYVIKLRRDRLWHPI